mmetsp:Transcript_135740/g.378192  ORF Transcript_135740/g.378192 Transcript_135740/m.378192 type:complete len:368 (+) Transcript_135740:44-1147(+)
MLLLSMIRALLVFAASLAPAHLACAAQVCQAAGGAPCPAGTPSATVGVTDQEEVEVEEVAIELLQTRFNFDDKKDFCKKGKGVFRRVDDRYYCCLKSCPKCGGNNCKGNCCLSKIKKVCEDKDGPPPCYYKNAQKKVIDSEPKVIDSEPPCVGSDCIVWADPHIIGFDSSSQREFPEYLSLLGLVGDGLGCRGAAIRRPINVNAYDTGDFWLVRSNPLQIQGRFVHSGEFEPDRAAVGALAVGGPILDGKRLVVEPLEGQITWDGKLVGQESLGANLTQGQLRLHTRQSHVEQGPLPSTLEAELPSGVRLVIARFQRHLDTRITLQNSLGAVDGECGNNNGDPEDDTELHVKERMGRLEVLHQDSLF